MFNSLMLEIAITRSQISKRDLAKKNSVYRNKGCITS